MNQKIEANIKKYYFYQLFNGLSFFAPVIVLFWQARGLNMTQIMVLQSIYAISVVLLELPTGVLADNLGKKASLIFGSLFFALGLFIYGASFKFWQFVIGEITVGVGSAFVSGADRAFLHETLKSLDREPEYVRVEGRARSLAQIAQALGNLGGGLIGSISLGLTLIASGVASLISLLIGFSLTETKIKLARKERTDYQKIIQESLRIIKDNRQVLWLVSFFAFFNSIIWITNWFTQPYLQMLNIPIVYFGIIFTGFSLVAALASLLTEWFEKISRHRPFMVISLAACILMFLISKFPNIYIFSLWSLLAALVVVNQTLVTHQVLSLIPLDRAATVLSFQNLLRRFIYAGFGPILGKISDSFGVLAALQANGVVLLLGLGVLIFWGRSLRVGA